MGRPVVGTLVVAKTFELLTSKGGFVHVVGFAGRDNRAINESIVVVKEILEYAVGTEGVFWVLELKIYSLDDVKIVIKTASFFWAKALFLKEEGIEVGKMLVNNIEISLTILFVGALWRGFLLR